MGKDTLYGGGNTENGWVVECKKGARRNVTRL